jgi:hypothetical protein
MFLFPVTNRLYASYHYIEIFMRIIAYTEREESLEEKKFSISKN